MASRAIDADLRQHRARYHLRGLAVPDFHDFLNAVSPHPVTRPAHASFEVSWTATGPRARIRDATFGFVGKFMPAAATIGFRVRDDRTGAVYHSLPDGQITVGAGIGHERNGVFFS